MPALALSADERSELESALRRTRDAHTWPRLRAMLLLAEGRGVGETARVLGVTRQVIWKWRKRYEAERTPSALDDRPRPGRPATLRRSVAQVLEPLMEETPAQHGYTSPGWTVGLLRRHLQHREGIHTSDRTIRRALHSLGYCWKRPRYALARRDPDRERKKNRAT